MGKKGASRLPVEAATSAGGVVYRRRDGIIEVVVCGRAADSVWSLPKGTPNPGESLEETAVREVTEETGLRVAIEARVGPIHYWFSRPQEGKRFYKTVHHYLMVATGGSVADHDHEFDYVEWRPLEEACNLLTYRSEGEVVRKAQAIIDKGDSQEAPS